MYEVGFNNNIQELRNEAEEVFYRDFGHSLNWDLVQLLEDIRHYYTAQQLIDFIEGK